MTDHPVKTWHQARVNVLRLYRMARIVGLPPAAAINMVIIMTSQDEPLVHRAARCYKAQIDEYAVSEYWETGRLALI